MPESPEIKYLTELLINNVNGEIKNIGKNLIEIKNIGKLIVFICSDNIYITCHLGLTGWIYFEKKSDKNYIMEFTNKVIYISGKIKILGENEYNAIIKRLGVDIFSKEFTKELLFDICKKTKENISKVLLKQDKICGIGNYIKNESLYHAGINPTRMANKLSQDKIYKLYDSIRYVAFSRLYSLLNAINSYIKLPIHKSISDIAPKNLTIPYEYNVYNRKNDLLGNRVISIRIDSRITFYVDELQK